MYLSICEELKYFLCQGCCVWVMNDLLLNGIAYCFCAFFLSMNKNQSGQDAVDVMSLKITGILTASLHSPVPMVHCYSQLFPVHQRSQLKEPSSLPW